jgi:hypothetical protein
VKKVFEKIFEFFRGKDEDIVYADIDFTEEAKERLTFDENNIKIFIKRGEEILDVWDYNSHNWNKLLKMKIPIYRTLEVPKPDFFLKRKLLLGRILIGRGRKWLE